MIVDELAFAVTVPPQEFQAVPTTVTFLNVIMAVSRLILIIPAGKWLHLLKINLCLAVIKLHRVPLCFPIFESDNAIIFSRYHAHSRKSLILRSCSRVFYGLPLKCLLARPGSSR